MSAPRLPSSREDPEVVKGFQVLHLAGTTMEEHFAVDALYAAIDSYAARRVVEALEEERDRFNGYASDTFGPVQAAYIACANIIDVRIRALIEKGKVEG